MRRGSRISACVMALSAGIAGLEAAPALAQEAGSQAAPPQAAPPSKPTPADKAVANLIDALVRKGALEKSQGDELLRQFQADINAAGPEAAANSAPGAATNTVPGAQPGVVHVPYVPQVVEDRIRDEVKSAVVAQAVQEHWATPNAFPAWVNRVTLIGDVRVRDEGRYFNRDNYWAFVNVGAINAGSPYNVGSNNNVLPPILNSTHDVNVLRLRARGGISFQADDDWNATLRIASGSDPSPVSTYQTFGGSFDKKSVWLDQAFLKYEPVKGDALVMGRMPNPFDTTPLVWYGDLNLDGIALTGVYHIPDTYTGLHAAAGAFPLEYVPTDFPATATSDQKVPQTGSKWVFAGQLGAAWQSDAARLSVSAGYYDFKNVQGDLSPSCSNLSNYCLTDYTRPGFMQKGNTLFALRSFNFPDPTNPSQPQYYGLASKFEVADLVARVDLRVRGNFHVGLTGDYARNLGYNARQIQALPIVNNNESCSVAVPANHTCASAGGTNVFKSGPTGWYIKLTAGAPDVIKRWDWNTWFTYEYIQPDAVLDALNDSDFHLGGTNAKGWIVGGNLGVGLNTSLTARWFSTDVVTGPAFSLDMLQVDITTRF